MKCERRRLLKHLVASVRTPDTNKEIVFLRQVGGYLSLAFASELPADNNINETIVGSAIETEVSRDPNEYVLLRVSDRIKYDIRNICKLANILFGFVLLHLRVGFQLSNLATPLRACPLRPRPLRAGWRDAVQCAMG